MADTHNDDDLLDYDEDVENVVQSDKTKADKKDVKGTYWSFF